MLETTEVHTEDSRYESFAFLYALPLFMYHYLALSLVFCRDLGSHLVQLVSFFSWKTSFCQLSIWMFWINDVFLAPWGLSLSCITICNFVHHQAISLDSGPKQLNTEYCSEFRLILAGNYPAFWIKMVNNYISLNSSE